MPNRNPRTLIFALSAKSMYRSTLYSEEEIFCGPDEVTRAEGDRIVTVNTPIGEFDASLVAAQLPDPDWPELLVVKLDATMRCVPRKVGIFKCPKVLVVGAPHQFERPIQNLLRYQELERFDIIVSDHDRHHLHWFKRAGWSRVHWIPGLNFCLRQRRVAPPMERKAIFVGQTGQFHPYRRELFRSLERAGLPIVMRTAPPAQTADLYARHAISLNGSLNGDLNLRVFEVLGSGGLLLTDRLSPDAGLELLFEDGKEILLYSGFDDLAEKVRYYLEHEDEALEIRRRGQARLLREHHPELKARQLLELVFDGKEEPAFAMEPDARYRSLGALPRENLFRDASLYEALQLKHLKAYSVIVYGNAGELAFAEDLPRLRYEALERAGDDLPESLPGDMEQARFLALGDASLASWENAVRRFVGNSVVAPEATGDLAELLAAHGFVAVAGRDGLFEQSNHLAAAARYLELGATRAARAALAQIALESLSQDALLDCAHFAIACGDAAICERALEQCLRGDRALIDAYLARGDALIGLGRRADALLSLREAARLSDALPPESQSLLDELERSDAARDPRLAAHRERVQLGGRPTTLDRPRRILVYTNLFPPQELGGYGRKMWEFAYELSLRGHEIRILAGDAPYLEKEARGEESALEGRASRELELYGSWKDGSISVASDPQELRRIARGNAQKLVAAIDAFRPDFCLMGNLDLLGHLAIEQLTMRGIPTAQCMGNALPGWPQDFRPDYRYYAAGPASEFLQRQMAGKGFEFARGKVLYPGARIDRFYRETMPRFDIPRIAFAGLLMAYKGAHTLVAALRLLKEGGIQFRATIAGDSTDRGYVEALKRAAAEGGFGDWIEFPGFLDRKRLAELFCRCNMMVFPSIFDEPFGISQVEALASGLALVTSGKGGSPEIVRDGVDGLMFKADDSLDLAKKIASLAADPARWESLATAGRERALEFSIPRTVDKIEALFAEMAASGA